MQSEMAVVSMTFEPLCRTSRYVTRWNFLALGFFTGIGGVDPVHLGRLEDDVALDLHRAQGGRGVGGEVGVADARGEDHHPALFHVADGPPADEGLGDLAHLDGGEHAGEAAYALQGILEGEAVDHRGQHPHVIGGDAVHAVRAVGHAPEDVAAADDRGDLDAETLELDLISCAR